MIETVQVVIIMLPWSFQSQGFWCEGGTGVLLGIKKYNIGKYKCSGSAIASISGSRYQDMRVLAEFEFT